MRTWLVIAAERREFSEILKHAGPVSRLDWKGVEFACEVLWKGDRWWFAANGPGPQLASAAVGEKKSVDGIVSTGFCGALDPDLRVGEIVVSGDPFPAPGVRRGEILSLDRVAVTSVEKSDLRKQTGAIAIEMEAAAVAAKAREWGVPFYCIRAVSDTASQDMPLDFNLYRDRAGRFSRSRIALTAVARPFTVMPALMRLDRNCRDAAKNLGDFFANCKF